MSSSTWMPGDDPETHPLWEEQVDLERGMLRSGADKFRDAVIIAETKGKLTRIQPVQTLANSWVPGVADTIKEWLRGVEKSKGGPKPIAYPYVKEIDPYVAAMVGVRTILNDIGKGRIGLVSVAATIGQTIEYEQRIRLWEEKEPELFHTLRKDMDNKQVTSEHRRRANINRFNAYLKEGKFETISWTSWSQEVTFRVGWTVLDCIIKKTGWFDVIDDPDYRPTKNRSPKLCITPKQGLTDWLANAFDRAETHSADFRPTIMPPKRWTSSREGGYWTPYVQAPRLVRFRASQEHQKEKAADEYDALEMPKVYRALNVLQETAWRVNDRVLDAVLGVWSGTKHNIKGLPERAERDLPPRTPRMIEHQEESRRLKAMGAEPTPPDEKTFEEIEEWKRQASPVYAFNAKRVARLRGVHETLLIADKYRKYEAIYFPHMLDFRGRMYPIPAFLNPQGNDLSRGLLTFAEGAPITQDNGGVRWLAISLASNWGHDKWAYDRRVQWVYDNEIMLRLIAEDPINNVEWTKCDKPAQTLAAIFEWVDYLNEGEGYISCLPIMVDGTCNGIQHLSAMTRDAVAGAYVNLVPSNEPKDIYKFVAGELQDTLEALAGGTGKDALLAKWWLELCEYDLPRTLTKRQVMVLPYGGTKDSFFTYTRAWLDEYHPVPGGMTPEQKAERKDRVVFLALHMWDTVNRVVSGGMRVMKWLQDCAKCAAVDDQPIYWKTPSGFVVRHFYGLERNTQLNLMLDGTRCQVRVAERTAKLSVREQLQGISPNFIHSLDASALTECLNRADDLGIQNFAAVHDAYGTHAANMDVLADLLRESFVATHEYDLLGMFREACIEMMIGPMVLKGMDPMEAHEKASDKIDKAAGRLEMGSLDLPDVLRSDYFFA